jgi:hypothetical protein
MKKIIVSTFSALLLMLILTSTAFAAHPAEKEHLRIKGTINLVEISHIDPVTHMLVSWTGIGSGRASHLGRFTDSFRVVLDPTLPLGNLTYYHFVAANGDSLFSSGPGDGTQIDPNSGHVVENHTITGGTGRFAGASGNLIIERLVTWIWETTPGVGSVGTSSGTFTGDIILAEDH